MPRSPLPRLLVACVLSMTFTTRAADAPWPTVRHDPARSAYTDQFVAGPYERKWFADFHDEVISTRVEAILAEGKVFVPTLAGRLHALDVTTGKVAWTLDTRGPIGTGPVYAGGRICVGSDDGVLYCVSAADGKVAWTFDAGASVWASPASDGRMVYVGDRAGVFHAVDWQTGREAWSFKTGGMFLAPASIYTPPGGARAPLDRARIVVASEDMHVYAFTPEGELAWRSAKLGGLSTRDHAPVIWHEKAWVTTNPAVSFHHAPGENPAILTKAQKALAPAPDDKVIHDKWGGFAMKPTPRRIAAEQEAILAHLKEYRAHQTLYALDLADGREPFTPAVLYTAGLHNTHPPLAIDAKTDTAYVWTASALSNYHVGVPGGAITVAKIAPDTGRTTPVYHANGDKMGWAFDFVAPADETQTLSVMGNPDGGTSILLNTHQGIVGGMRLDTLKWHRVYIARDTYAGIFGPAALRGSFDGADKAHAAGVLALMANQWHGPDQGAVSIGYDRLFWIAGSQVVCLGVPSTPKTDTGGTKPPAPIQRKHKPVTPGGNVATNQIGAFDANIPKVEVNIELARRYVTLPDTSPSRGLAASAASLSEKSPPTRALPPPTLERLHRVLAEQVRDLLTTDLAPLIVELGISGEDRYFWRSAETLQSLAGSLPHLDADLRAEAVAKIGAMLDAGMPLGVPVHPDTPNRREAYDLGPEMRRYASNSPQYAATIEDVYALWAAAHYADHWDKARAQWPAARKLAGDFVARPIAFTHDDKEATDAAEHLNAQIAGLIAASRLARHFGQADEAEKWLGRLAELIALRVQHEQADTRFVRPTKTAANKLHQAKIPRYCAMTPEVGRILRDLAGEAVRRNLADVGRDLPLRHHAWGERMIGGENYVSPPHLAWGLFMTNALTGDSAPSALLARLDQPWCRGDLYYIQKVTALLNGAN